MASISNQNLTLEKACRVNLGFDEGICDALTARNASHPEYKVSEQAVQTLSANIAIWRNIIQGIVPSLLLLFLGSWSDRHGKRKPLILNPILGEIITCFCFLVATYFFYQLPMEFNVLAEAIPSITGSWFAMFVGTFSYISGVSSPGSRTARIGNVHLVLNVSICLGIALAGVLYDMIGLYGVYSLSLIMYSCGYFYGSLYVKDVWEYELERKLENVEEEKRGKKSFLADFFDIKHVMETLKIAFKSGERNRKTRVCLLLIVVIVVSGPLNGEMNVSYYYVRYKFGWNSIDYSMFATFQFVAHTMGTMFSLAFFAKYLKLDDSILGMISSGSKILGALFYAFAPTPLFFYLGALAEVLNATSFIAMRSIISKLVPSDELGKINSLFGLAEASVPLLYGPVYSKVYAATITFFPGAFYLVGAGLTFPAVLIFIWLYTQHRMDEKEKARNKLHEEKLIGSEQKQEKMNENITDEK
ncbi:hypothetical protein JTB14_010208 [Gonioctena quinquepunctata]|nr:hypothetical protein JTB14_010208 [Gonioctena quinquepunctata]